MTALLLWAQLSCPATLIINHTDYWDEYDKLMIVKAVEHCALKKANVCLKAFTKLGTLQYRAICGVKQ